MFRPPSWPQIESNDKTFAEGGVLPSHLRVSSAILYACGAVPRPYGRRGKVMNPVHLAVQRLFDTLLQAPGAAGEVAGQVRFSAAGVGYTSVTHHHFNIF